MKVVKVSSRIAPELLLRQSPGNAGIWDDVRFLPEEDVAECDAWVVFDGLQETERTVCARDKVIFITGEPPSIKGYDHRFLRQFGTIVTAHEAVRHPGVLRQHQALPWMIGGKYDAASHRFTYSFADGLDFDELSRLQDVEKDRLISVILSQKSSTEGHRARNRFVGELKRRLGSDLDVFGVGYREIRDKFDGLAPYHYHLALENSRYPDYWTEKLSDAFLSFAYPFYHGCPNIGSYFPDGSLTVIDIEKVDESISIIENAVRRSVSETARDRIVESRNLVLNRYNFFPTVVEILRGTEGGRKRLITLRPESDFGSRPGASRVLRHLLHRGA